MELPVYNLQRANEILEQIHPRINQNIFVCKVHLGLELIKGIAELMGLVFYKYGS